MGSSGMVVDLHSGQSCSKPTTYQWIDLSIAGPVHRAVDTLSVEASNNFQ